MFVIRKIFEFFRSPGDRASRVPKQIPGGSSKTLAEDIVAAAQWISEALRSSGYKADFTFESMLEIERFFSEQSENGVIRPDGLLAQNLGSRLFALGSYCGEVIRLELGGEWTTDDNSPDGEIHAALKIGEDIRCWPIQRVMKRLKGNDANLVHWAEALRGDASK